MLTVIYPVLISGAFGYMKRMAPSRLCCNAMASGIAVGQLRSDRRERKYPNHSFSAVVGKQEGLLALPRIAYSWLLKCPALERSRGRS